MKRTLKARIKALLLDDIQNDLGIAQFNLATGFFWTDDSLDRAVDKLIISAREVFAKKLESLP